MNADAELLNFIYQNSQMGVETMKQLLPMADNEAFKEHLNAELKEYTGIHEKAKDLLNQHGLEEKDIGALEKVMAYLSIDMKTFVDKSASHMAEMLIRGGTMGIIDCNKRIKQYEGDADKDIVALMKNLLKVEEEHIERLKKML
jgi:hypothetical protein